MEADDDYSGDMEVQQFVAKRANHKMFFLS